MNMPSKEQLNRSNQSLQECLKAAMSRFVEIDLSGNFNYKMINYLNIQLLPNSSLDPSATSATHSSTPSSRTKFGGQPEWVTTPQWPLSRATGRPMRFLCQIEIDPRLFPGSSGKMAYVFMTDEGDDYIEGTEDPEGGENCVVVQPSSDPLPTQVYSSEKGPSLLTMCEDSAENSEFLVPRELAYLTVPLLPEKSLPQEDPFFNTCTGSTGIRLGGLPNFLQGEEFPDSQHTQLLLQLDSAKVPFWLNFGDAGIGYVFLNKSGSSGRMLWQSA